MPERKEEAAGQVTGVGEFIALPEARRERPGGQWNAGAGCALRPAREAREVEAAGAREEHERPVAECPRLRGLRSGGRAGGSSNVARRPQWREQPPQRPPRQCGGAEARSLPASRRPPARGRPGLAPGRWPPPPPR